jgi:putative SOS response-associated peptidase YedK
VGVCGPSSIHAMKVSRHHSSGDPTGVREETLATQSQFCSILAEHACLLPIIFAPWRC